MPRRKHYNSYTDSFKATAVALSNIEGIKAADVADALFIHPVMLYRWRMETQNGELMAKKKDINVDPGKNKGKIKDIHKLDLVAITT